MKSKINISKKIFLFLLVLSYFFLAGQQTPVFADVFTDNPVATDEVLTIQIKDFLPAKIDQPFKTGKDVGTNGLVYAEIYDVKFDMDHPERANNIVCSSDTRIAPAFCDAMMTCHVGYVDNGPVNFDVTDGCHRAIGKIFNDKMNAILQAEIDGMISDAGLDVSDANSTIEECQGDLTCIKNILEFLKTNPIEQINSPADEADDLGDISDLINSSRTGPINSASNDPMGLANKEQAPKVEVIFGSKTNPSSSSIMTATAIPSFFNNASNPRELYFTWYLKRKDCENKKDVSSQADAALKAKCDLDDDDEITENDWKIAAARIIIAGNFDNSAVNYDNFPTGVDEKTAGYKATPSPKNNDNEWQINSGEDSNPESAPSCYVQAPKTGISYELVRVTDRIDPCPDDAEGNKYKLACAKKQSATCSDVLNPLYDPVAAKNVQDTIDAAILWNSNPANEPIPVPSAYSVPLTAPHTTNEFCEVLDQSTAKTFCKIAESENNINLVDFQASVACTGSGVTPICVKESGNTTTPTEPSFSNKATAAVFNNGNLCSSLTPNTTNNPLFPELSIPAWLNTQNSIYNDIQGQSCDSANDLIRRAINPGLIVEPTCTFERDANLCKHLFPAVPNEITGDGKFTLEEKKFWGADPTKASTSENGKDEERAVGLGVDKFEWMLSPGDQVGVVVEGESMIASKHADASFKRTWAFSKNKCSALEKLDDIDKDDLATGDDNEGKVGFYLEGSGGAECNQNDSTQRCVGFLTAEIDLNNCLEENLLEPDTETSTGLSLQLSAMPENPVNDENGRGDVLSIASEALNTQDVNGLFYNWSVQKSLSGKNPPIETTNWEDITSEMLNGGSFSEGDLVGIAKDKLAINLNIKNDLIGDDEVFYLRIRVKATGTAVDGTQVAKGEIIIRIKQQQNELLVYPVIATNIGMLNLKKESAGSSLERCANNQGEACPVVKNEIIGVIVPKTYNTQSTNFSWSVNGAPISCDNSVSTECAEGNILFFPVLGNIGEAINVTAKGINANNEAVEISRQFVIVVPELRIESVDNNAWPKLLGFYKDLNSGGSCLDGGSGCYADLSVDVMEAAEGSLVTLRTPPTGVGFDWAIDGQINPSYKNQNQIQIRIEKMAGESYDIGVSTQILPENITQLNNVRKALYRNWKIVPSEVVEENQNVNMQLDVVAGSADAVAAVKKTNFGASLITHLPEQLLFLLKISLTSILVLVLAGVLFAFIPENTFRKETA